MTEELHNKGFNVNHKHVSSLHKELGLETIYPHAKQDTSQGNPGKAHFDHAPEGKIVFFQKLD